MPGFTTAIASGLFAALAAAAPAATANPLRVGSVQVLGYRNSTNTESLRDLGFMGNIGNTWMLSFGDGVGTKNHNTFDQTQPAGSQNGACAYITARDGGGVPSDNPLYYRDITVIYNVGGCGNVPQMGYWCPKLAGEEDAQGLGITNVMEINSTTGVIWTRPTKSGSDFSSAGAGLAMVQLQNNADPKCTRPFGKSTWTTNEPDWGQLSAVSGKGDGYTYVFANSYHNGQANNQSNKVVLARVPKAQAFNLNSYEYWHGASTGFNKNRILISNLNDNSAENLVGLDNVGQGTAFYSTYYKKFIYFNMGISLDNRNLYAWTADQPQGPWSERITLYSDPLPEPPSGFDYGGYIMPKFTSSDGKTIYLSWTRAAYYEAVIKMTFA